MTKEVSKRQLPVLQPAVKCTCNASVYFFRLSDTFEQQQEHLFENIVMFDFGLEDEGDRCEVIISFLTWIDVVADVRIAR